MVMGMTPIAATFGFMAGTTEYRGDAALGAAMLMIYGCQVGYLATLLLAYPALVWSYWLCKTKGLHSRWASALRTGVIIVLLSPFVIFVPLAIGAVFS